MIRTHPLWRPFQQPTEQEIAAARVHAPVAEAVEVVPADPAWPAAYDALRALILEALGERVLAVEHIGSTSVPGLWAKPIIDVDLTVADSGDEAAWLPELEAAGLELRVREPQWEEHRCLRSPNPRGNVHVWSPGAFEPRRQVAFRDWLRAHETDRERYATAKRKAADRGFTDAMLYNNAKSATIYDLYEVIFLADPGHVHDGVPREGT